MFGLSRRAAVSALLALSLAACGSGGDAPAQQISQDESDAPAEIGQDMIKGSADAPLTLVEYASWTCGACLQFHNDVIPMLEEEYIATGKVRLVFREFPTAPANVSLAGFVIGRCLGEDVYFDVIDELFVRQPGILSLVRNGGAVREALVQVGLNHGLADDAAFDACLADETHRRNIATAVQRGEAQGVNSTPTVFLNGEQLPGFEWRSADGMRAVLDAALAELEGPAETAADEVPVEEVSVEAETEALGDPAESADTEAGD